MVGWRRQCFGWEATDTTTNDYELLGRLAKDAKISNLELVSLRMTPLLPYFKACRTEFATLGVATLLNGYDGTDAFRHGASKGATTCAKDSKARNATCVHASKSRRITSTHRLLELVVLGRSVGIECESPKPVNGYY